MELRDYQKLDVEFMVKQKRVYNTNEPGLGKTIETLTASRLCNSTSILIVGPKVSLGVWQDEALQWFGEESIIYSGTPKKREKLWKQFVDGKYRILICTYKMSAEVQKRKHSWFTIIADEIHLAGLLNPKTQTFKSFTKFASQCMYLLTGTPVKKGPQDIWGPAHLLYPQRFKAYWSFVNTFCIVEQGMFGKEIGNKPKDPLAFKQMLSTFLIRRRKQDVIAELPDKVRQIVPLELEGKQLELYEELANNMMAEVPGGELIITPNAATQILRLRQLLIAPQIFGFSEPGAGIEALAELIEIEFDAGRSVLVFTPFREAIKFIEAHLKEKLNVPVWQIHGEIDRPASEIAKEFQNYQNHRKILIGTIRTGVSYTAHSASVEFFLGYEWGADQNKQAEDRAHRIGQKDTVFVKYLTFKGTVDDLVMDKLNRKQGAENWILRTEEVIAKIKEQQNRSKI